MAGQGNGAQHAKTKGIRERIMDCISFSDQTADTHLLLTQEDMDNEECIKTYVSDLTRSELSTVWNQYRHRKWANDETQPPLEESERRLIELVPKYSAFFSTGKVSVVDVAFIPLFPFERPRLQKAIQSGEMSRRSLHLRFNRQIDSISDNLLDYLTNIDLNDHLAVACSVYEKGSWKTIATARVIREKDQPEWAEWAAIVADPYHCNTIGSCLLYYISEIALSVGVEMLYAVVNPANAPVIHWMRKLGAKVQMRQNVNVWCFPIPLPETWIESEVIRTQIVHACHGSNTLPDFVKEHIEMDIKSIREF